MSRIPRRATAIGGIVAGVAMALGAAMPANAAAFMWSNIAPVPAVYQSKATGAITVGQGSYNYHWRIDGVQRGATYYGSCAQPQCVISPTTSFAPGLTMYILNPDRSMKSVYLGLGANPPAGAPAPSAVVTVTPLTNN